MSGLGRPNALYDVLHDLRCTELPAQFSASQGPVISTFSAAKRIALRERKDNEIKGTTTISYRDFDGEWSGAESIEIASPSGNRMVIVMIEGKKVPTALVYASSKSYATFCVVKLAGLR